MELGPSTQNQGIYPHAANAVIAPNIHVSRNSVYSSECVCLCAEN